MARKLSLSQAARLIGISRKEIQAKIQKNELRVMEGTVTLEDLKKAYPDAQYEDNTILERMQEIMEKAIHKMSESEHEDARLQALGKRVFLLNQELAKEKARAAYYQELINKLQQKFVELSTQAVDKSQIISLQKWLRAETEDAQPALENSSQQLMETQIQQFMLPHVRLLPSRHDFISDKSETLLESALHAGLAVDYGCSNGKCGKCKMKLIAGKVEKVRHIDYVLSAQEKQQNYILSCSHRAVTDVVLETTEAVSADDIPLQTINTRVKNIDRINEKYFIVNLKTPRSQRLRFLAGQEMILKTRVDDQLLSYQTVISSCPCDDLNIQFHFLANDEHPLVKSLVSRELKSITIEGPCGSFILDEDSPRSLVFIAFGFGFSHIISLIEHALALDLEETIHLYWIVQDQDDLYMNNKCRSWNDALDTFEYHPVICHDRCIEDQQQIAADVLSQLHQVDKLENNDYYIAGVEEMVQSISALLVQENVDNSQIHRKIIK